MFGGTLKNLTPMRRMCQCNGAPHTHIVGKEKSKASGTYPLALCEAYGKLAAQHFLMMGKAEFLDAKHRNLKKVIQRLQKKAEEMRREYGKMAPVTPPRRLLPPRLKEHRRRGEG